MLDAGGIGAARDRHGVGQRGGDRLLAIDVLAGVDRSGEQRGAQIGGCGVEEQRVLRVGERGVEVGGPALHLVPPRQGFKFSGITADQDRIGHQHAAVTQFHPAVVADRQDAENEMLVLPHAPGDAVHDDADPSFAHGP